ncbi:hypothetical protein [Sphingomonas sp. SRS2]|uniref:hypothetical protein n=1 Tax=Sphingomonas sp. SRS2 TaxID=133190 RepID=UPI000618493C|nr:hypothetical protein [Sphingomonas sp. SRS2]KKC24444.1 hypothetical protein WP12_19325 [Sphingomonas sp. SRS2]
MNLPAWPARDLRAFIALAASVGGSIALTGFAAAVVAILWLGEWPVSTAELRIGLLGKALMLSLAGSLLVLISLGLAINKRSVKLSRDGLDVSGGDEPAQPVITTTTTTAVTAQEAKP